MKKIKFSAILIALSFICPALYADAPKKDYNDLITLTIDNFQGRYAIGDTVKVNATMDPSIAGEELVMEVFENCSSVSKTTVTAGSGIIFKSSYDKPVSVMVRLYPAKDAKNNTTIGFIVGDSELRPGMEMPKDFQKFWKKQVKALRKVPMKAEAEPVEIPGPSSKKFDCWSVRINSIDSIPCIGYLVKPKDAAPKSLPIVIFLHGAGVNKPGSRSNITTAVKYARYGSKGCISFDLNAHGMENNREQAYYDNLFYGRLKDYSTRPIVDHETFLFRTMFLRVVRTLDYLCQDPCWDGRVLIFGSSQGGAQTAAICGLDKRVGAAVLLVPAMVDMGGDLAGHGRSWCMRYLKEPNYEIAKYYDGANFLRFYTGKLHVEAGLIDEVCPAVNVFSGYNMAASTEKEIFSYPYRPHSETLGKHTQPWKDIILKSREDFMQEYLK